MLPRTRRLSTQAVALAGRRGKEVRHGWLSLRVLPQEKGKTRFAVVVSKKVAKTAVTRNLLRRWAFHALSAQASKGSFDGILTVRAKYESFSKLSADLKGLFGLLPSLVGR